MGYNSLSDQGINVRAINPTPDTGIAQSIITAFSATNGLLTIFNSSPLVPTANPTTDSTGIAAVSNLTVPSRTIYLDYIRLIPTVAPASATKAEMLISLDNKNRFSSGGTALTEVVASQFDANQVNQAVSVMTFGALTLNAESSSIKRISRAQLFSAIPVVGSEFIIIGGAADAAGGTLGGTVATRVEVPVGPIIIPPGWCMTLHTWFPANAVTPASWELEVSVFER